MKLRIDGLMVLVVVVLSGGIFAYFQKDKLLGFLSPNINPTSQDNVINKGVEAIVGVDAIQDFSKPFFETFDFVTDPEVVDNPINDMAETYIGTDTLQTIGTPLFKAYDKVYDWASGIGD